MGINIGEVEAVLAVRDNMSPALVAAAEKVKALRMELEALGPVTAENAKQINALQNQLGLSMNAFKLAGEAQERQAAIAAEVAARSAALAEAQDKQTVSAQGAAVASKEVSASLTEQVTATEAAIAAQSTLGVKMAAQQAAQLDVTTRLSKVYATLGEVGVQGPALAGGGFSQNTALQIKSFAELEGQMVQLESSLRAMTSAEYVAQVRATSLAQGQKQAAAALSSTKMAGTEAAEGIDATGAAAARGTASMAQMESMAIRLVERLLILYAIRATFTATKDMFVDAESLIKMNETSEVSIRMLQELRFGSEQLGIDFTKTGTAIDYFQKQIAGMTPQAARAIETLHLSFSQLFALNADQQLQAVFEAIDKLPPGLDRAEVSAKLFGQDGILPLITKFDSLKSAAHDANAVIIDENVRVMANTVTLYRQFLTDITPIASEIIATGQKAIAALFAPLFGGGAEFASMFPKGMLLGDRSEASKSTAGIREFLFNLITQGGVGATAELIESIMRGAPPPPIGDVGPSREEMGPRPGTPLMGQAYIDSLRTSAPPITVSQRQQLDELRELNQLTLEHALHVKDEVTQVSLTEGQFKAYERSIQNAKHALTEINRETKLYIEEQDRINTLWERYIALHNSIADDKATPIQRDEMGRARELSEAGGRFSEGKSDQWQLREEQDSVNRYWDEKEVEDQGKIDAKEVERKQKVADDIQRIRDQSFAAEAETNVRGLALQIALLDRQEQMEKDAWQKKLDDKTINGIELEEARTAISDKFNAERNRRSAKWEADKWEAIGQIEEQAFAVEASLMGNTMQAQLALNDRQLSSREASLAKQGKLDADYIQGLGRLHDDNARKIILSFDPLWKAWQDLNGDMRVEWAQTWDQAFEKGEGFVGAMVAPFTDLVKGFEKMLGGMMADWEYMLLAPMLSSFRNTIGGMFGMSNTGPGGGFGTTASKTGIGYTVGPGGSLIPVGASSGYEPSDAYGGASSQEGPYYKGYEPPPGFGAMAGAGLLTGVGAVLSGGSVGHQLVNEGMMAAGISTSVAMLTGSIASGIVAGAVTFGIGAAVIGGIVLIKHMMHTAADDVARDSGQEFGQAWSDGLQKEIVDRSKKLFKGDTVSAELFSLPDIMKENPVTFDNLDMYEGKVHDIFSMIQQGHFTVAQATQDLDATFPALAAVATDAYGRITEKLKEIVQLQGQMGTNSKAIADWVHQQVDTAGSSLPTIVTGVLTGSHSKEDVASLGQQVELTFAAMVAAGKDPLEVMKELGPTIEQVRRAYAAMGIAADDAALRQLFMMSKLNAAHPELLAGMEALIKSMVSFDNIGVETTALFASQEKSGLDMWDKIKRATIQAGGTETDALSLIQGFLHEAMIEAQRLGVPLDANIQKLIDLSKASGVWQDNLTVHPTTISALDALIARIDKLINALLGIPNKVNVSIGIGTGGGGGSTDPGGIDHPGLDTSGLSGISTTSRLAVFTPNTGTVANVYIDNRGALIDEYGTLELIRRLQTKFWERVSFNENSSRTNALGALGGKV